MKKHASKYRITLCSGWIITCIFYKITTPTIATLKHTPPNKLALQIAIGWAGKRYGPRLSTTTIHTVQYILNLHLSQTPTHTPPTATKPAWVLPTTTQIPIQLLPTISETDEEEAFPLLPKAQRPHNLTLYLGQKKTLSEHIQTYQDKLIHRSPPPLQRNQISKSDSAIQPQNTRKKTFNQIPKQPVWTPPGHTTKITTMPGIPLQLSVHDLPTLQSITTTSQQATISNQFPEQPTAKPPTAKTTNPLLQSPTKTPKLQVNQPTQASEPINPVARSRGRTLQQPKDVSPTLGHNGSNGGEWWAGP